MSIKNTTIVFSDIQSHVSFELDDLTEYHLWLFSMCLSVDSLLIECGETAQSTY